MNPRALTGAQISELLQELGTRLEAKGVAAELFIVGGSALSIAYGLERATVDIDALFEPRDFIIEIAKEMADIHKLPTDWLNDSVRQVMPPLPDADPHTIGQFGTLTVKVASEEYLLAMKAMVSRKLRRDLDDGSYLAARLGITDEREVERIVKRYYSNPAFGAQELWFEDIAAAAQHLHKNSQ